MFQKCGVCFYLQNKLLILVVKRGEFTEFQLGYPVCMECTFGPFYYLNLEELL